MRFAAACIFSVLSLIFGTQAHGADSIDLVLVATAPSLFTEARIKEHFTAGLNGVSQFGPLNDRLTVESITYSEYQDLKRLAERSVGVVEEMIESPLVLKAAEQGWIVKAPDAGMNVAGIEVRYTTAGEASEQSQKFDVDAKDASAQGSKFRVRSKVLGDFTFLPEPAWDLSEYRLLLANGPSTKWQAWPEERTRILIRVERFPADETSYGELKAKLAENEATPIRFNGEREGLFSIANLSSEDPGGRITPDRWSQGAYELTLKAPKTDDVWVLFPLTKSQKDLAVAQLKSAVKRQGETERSLASKFSDGTRPVAGHVIAKQNTRELSGRVGAQWQHLDAQGDDVFRKTFTVMDSDRWGRVFQKKDDSYYLYVQIVNQQAATIGEGGEFWGVASPANWNGGQNPDESR
ncbi:MAG: hypothetical protein KDA84_10610 [Planctomycetaceae bacterium]|nr:hypothetical protein [Planctomycetaceae bacterium]